MLPIHHHYHHHPPTFPSFSLNTHTHTLCRSLCMILTTQDWAILCTYHKYRYMIFAKSFFTAQKTVSFIVSCSCTVSQLQHDEGWCRPSDPITTQCWLGRNTVTKSQNHNHLYYVMSGCVLFIFHHSCLYGSFLALSGFL